MEFEVDVPTINSEDLSLVIKRILLERSKEYPKAVFEWHIRSGMSEEIGQAVLNFLANKIV